MHGDRGEDMQAKQIGAGVVAGVVVFALGQVATALIRPPDATQDLLTLPARQFGGGAAPDSDAADPREGDFENADLTMPEDAEGSILFAAFKGEVEVKLKGDEWAPADRDLRMAAGTQIRTGADGHAKVLFDAKSHLQMQPGTELAVKVHKPEATTFVLHTGRLRIASLTTEKKVRILGPRRSGYVIARNARIEIFARPGALGVINDAGDVDLKGKSKVLSVPEGMSSYVLAGKNPSRPRVWADDPELKIKEPGELETDQDSFTLTGSAHPLAEVLVNDEPVKLSAKGTFRTKVPLEIGENPLRVAARLPGAELQERELPSMTRVGDAVVVEDPELEPVAEDPEPVVEDPEPVVEDPEPVVEDPEPEIEPVAEDPEPEVAKPVKAKKPRKKKPRKKRPKKKTKKPAMKWGT